MPTVPNITSIVQHFAGCSAGDAERAASRICRDPEATDLLVRAAMKCGVATGGVGLGWLVASAGVSPVSVPLLGAGAGIATYSAAKARRFCSEMIGRWDQPITDESKDLLRE